MPKVRRCGWLWCCIPTTDDDGFCYTISTISSISNSSDTVTEDTSSTIDKAEGIFVNGIFIPKLDLSWLYDEDEIREERKRREEMKKRKDNIIYQQRKSRTKKTRKWYNGKHHQEMAAEDNQWVKECAQEPEFMSRTEKSRPKNIDYEVPEARKARDFIDERSKTRITRREQWEKNHRSPQESYRPVEEIKQRSEESRVYENKELKLQIVNNKLIGKNHEVSQYLAQYSEIQEMKAVMDHRIKSNIVDYYTIQHHKNEMKDDKLRNLSQPKVTNFWESNVVDKLEMEWAAKKRSEILKNMRSVLYSPYLYGSNEKGTHVDAYLGRLNQKYTRILKTIDNTTKDTVADSCYKELASKDTRLDWDIIGLDWRTKRNPIIDSILNKYLKKDPEEPIVPVKKESPRNRLILPGIKPPNAAKSDKLPVREKESLQLNETKSLKESIIGKKKRRATRKITPLTVKNDLLNSLYKTKQYESCFPTDYSVSINGDRELKKHDGKNINATKELKQSQLIEKPGVTVHDTVKKTDFSIFLASSVSVHRNTNKDEQVQDEVTTSKSESSKGSGYSENQRKCLKQKFKDFRKCLTFRKDNRTAEEKQIKKIAQRKAKEEKKIEKIEKKVEKKKEKEEMKIIYESKNQDEELTTSCSEMSGMSDAESETSVKHNTRDNLTLTSLESCQHHGGICREEEESSVDEEEEATMRYLNSMV